MNLSGADIKGAFLGLPFVVLIIVVINLILGFFFDSVYMSFVGFMGFAGSYLMGTLLLSLIFSAICIGIGGLIRGGISIVTVLRGLKK